MAAPITTDAVAAEIPPRRTITTLKRLPRRPRGKATRRGSYDPYHLAAPAPLAPLRLGLG